MLKKTNILALVGEDDLDKKDSDFSSDKLIIWDDLLNKRISELILNSEIINVKIKLDKIIAVTKNNYLYVVEISDLEIKNIFQIYQSLFAVSMDDKILVLAFPYKHSGYVKIKKYNSKINIPSINAHDSNISFLSLSHDGNLLATSSEYGTIIRIFSTHDGQLIQELRRGAKRARIHYISFDLNNKFLACSSNSGTIHIFSIYSSIKFLKEQGIIEDKLDTSNKKNIKGEIIEQPKNQKSFIGSIINVLKIGISYFESEWSFAQFRIPKNEGDNAIVNFSSTENSINVLTKTGNLYKASFDPSLGGECQKINEINLLQQNLENI
jgi:WD40 repeat protein